MAHLAQQQTDYELAASFGEGSLFIDDCPDSTDNCTNSCVNEGTAAGGNCYDWKTVTCNPCGGSYSYACNQQLLGCNGNACGDDVQLCGSYGCCQGECCVNNGMMTCPC